MAIRHPGLKDVKETAKCGVVVSFAVKAFQAETHHCYVGENGAIVFSPNHGISLRHDIATALNFAAQRRRDVFGLAKFMSVGARSDAHAAIRRARNDIALMALRGVRLP